MQLETNETTKILSWVVFGGGVFFESGTVGKLEAE